MTDEERAWQAEQMWKAAVDTFDRKRVAGQDEHAALLAAVMAYSRAQRTTAVTLAQRQIMSGK